MKNYLCDIHSMIIIDITKKDGSGGNIHPSEGFNMVFSQLTLAVEDWECPNSSK